MLAARLVCLRTLPSKVFHPAFTKASPVVKNSITKNQWLLTPSRVKTIWIVFILSVFLFVLLKPFFFFDNMKLPTLPVVIYWNSLDNVPNQLFLLISFVSFYSIFISYERKRKNSYNCFFPYSSWSFSFRVICEGLRTVWCSIEIVEPIIKSFRI